MNSGHNISVPTVALNMNNKFSIKLNYRINRCLWKPQLHAIYKRNRLQNFRCRPVYVTETKIPEMSNSKERNINFGSRAQRDQSWLGPVSLRALMAQCIPLLWQHTVEKVCAHLTVTEKLRERELNLVSDSRGKGVHQWLHFLQLIPTSNASTISR